MPQKSLTIDQLKLDLTNPRISKASDQREAMQKIIEDQGPKLANLAESILNEGLNPMDRLLVMKSGENDGSYVVLEGNRRAIALKILKNPALVTSLDIPSAVKKRFERLAESFDPKSIEPVSCFEVSERADGNIWIEQRHVGEDEGRGIVSWSGVASSRFRGRDPALQALDFVNQHGRLSDAEKVVLQGRFPITTLDRLLSTPSVREKIGFEIRDGKLLTNLPADEAIKPIKRMVLDLAEKKVTVTDLKLKNQQVEYVSKFSKVDSPDLAKKAGQARAIEEFGENEFRPAQKTVLKKTRVVQLSARLTVVPRSCRLNVTIAKIGEIYAELRGLRLAQNPHAIAVLLRVFLETSVDQYLTKNSISLTVATGGGTKDKSLTKKLQESTEDLIKKGSSKKDFQGVFRGISNKNHPFSMDLLHSYVHSRFISPTERDLTAAWDSAQPLFERIWP